MVKFSFEVPIKHLHDFEEEQDFLFTLSFLYKHPEYREYVREVLDVGAKAVWLDNSFNELEQAETGLILTSLAEEYDFTRVISPDDPTWTKEQIATEYAWMVNRVAPNKLMAVVSSAEMLAHMKSLGARNFAYSYRVRLGRSYESMMWANQCHFLGLLSPFELDIIKPPTCDTSMPIKLALDGTQYSEWMRWGCQHLQTYPNFFDAEMTNVQIIRAKDNIKRLKEFVNGREQRRQGTETIPI